MPYYRNQIDDGADGLCFYSTELMDVRKVLRMCKGTSLRPKTPETIKLKKACEDFLNRYSSTAVHVLMSPDGDADKIARGHGGNPDGD